MQVTMHKDCGGILMSVHGKELKIEKRLMPIDKVIVDVATNTYCVKCTDQGDLEYYLGEAIIP